MSDDVDLLNAIREIVRAELRAQHRDLFKQKYLTIKEVAALLGTSESSVYRWRRNGNGKFPHPVRGPWGGLRWELSAVLKTIKRDSNGRKPD